MNFRTFLPLLFLSFLTIFSCNRNSVRIMEFTPVGEVDQLQSFTVRFSEDLAPEDQQDQWLSDEFISFEPAIDGRFKWINASTLIFSPDRAMKPSTDYVAKVNKKAVLFGNKKSANFDPVSFNTPHFDVIKVDFFYTRVPKSDFQVTVQANIHFNYEVDPTQLAKKLSVSRGKEAVKNFEIVTQDPAKIIAVNFGEMKQTKESQKFTVEVQKGLAALTASRPLSENREFDLDVPPVSRLAITGTGAGFEGDKAWIEVSTTQEVDKDKAKKFISVTPSPKNLEITVMDNRLRIEGDFKAGNTVNLKIAKGLPGLYGGTLEDEYTEAVILADLDPSLGFADELGTYLVRGGYENIKIEATNIKKAEVEVFEVFKNNLLFFLYENYSYSDHYIYDYGYDENQYYNVNYYGKPLYTENLEFTGLLNNRESATINLNKVLGQRFKGIYVVQVRSDEDYWMNSAKIVSISDMGVIAKYSGDELLVFVNSLKSATAIENAKVSLISANNQTLVSGTTDFDGFVKFSNLRKDVEGFEPRLVVVEKAEDFNYVDLRASEVETSRYDVGGKYVPSDGFDTFMYSDRNIYRPGETAFISAIVRDANMGIVTDMPVVVKVVNPRGKEFANFKKTLSSQGSFDIGIELPDFAQTGQYVAEVYTGTDKFLSSYRFNVEEFVPDKIRVNLDQDKERVKPGESVKIQIESEYLFGAPAANHKYEMDVRLRHVPYRSTKFKDFNFSDYRAEDTYLENDFSEGSLDENGQATESFSLPAGVSSGGYIQGSAYVSVFDVTGRTVNRTASFKAFPKDYFIGIKSRGYYYGTNKDITFDVIAVNPDDAALSAFDGEAELVRYEWQTVLEKNNNSGRYLYRSVEKEIPEWTRNVSVKGGPQAFTFRVDKSGRYELRIRKKGDKEFIVRRFYAYYWGSATASSFEIDKEGEVEIILDKESYSPNEPAKVLFVTPFTGKMLVTVEREKVLDYFYVDMEKNSKEISIKLNGAYVPNVYISATVFRPHTAESNVPFLVGHGYTAMTVSNPSNQLPVTIQAPDRIKPRTSQEITVKTVPEKDVFVTIAVVDEGILQVKNFQTPDPYNYMYGKRKLLVESYDMYKYLLPEEVSPLSAPAGGDEEGAKRLNPVKAKRFKLLAKWSGIRKTNSRGEVTIPVDIPQYNGEVRIMAVAYSGARFGSADKAMKISDDVILMPAVPRFLSIGDSLEIPVSVMNTTDKQGKVEVSLQTDGPLKVLGGKSESVTIAGNGTESVRFRVKASDAVGVSKMKFTSSGIDKVEEEIEIAVRPISPFLVESMSGDIKAGSSVDVQLPTGFLDGTEKTTLVVSNFPAIKFAKQLRYLIGYPHGCVEQTTSKLFPQLYFNELASLVAPEMYKRGNPVYFVKEGIRKLEGMNRYDGAFSYWPGGEYYNWWGSAYATHFMVEAKKAGFEVNASVLENALDFLAKKSAEKDTYDYVTYEGGKRTVKKIAPKESLYALYVLALAGEPDVPLMNYYRGRPHLLTGDTRYLLAGAFALSNNWNAYNELIPQTFSAEVTERLSGGSFDSEIRANAIMLNVLLDVDPSSSKIPGMIKYLSQNLDKAWSTQDRSWSFLALGKAAKRRGDSKVSIDVLVDGKKVKTITDANESWSDPSIYGKKITLKATGSGETYYFCNSEGIRTKGVVKEVDENMSVRRTYYDRFGNTITGNRFKQGQLIVCRISLTGGSRSVENVAVSDLIPAGFEIENPRIGTSADLAWVDKEQNRFSPAYLDVRDDRLLIFTDVAGNRTKSYFYMLRVVNSGVYQLPAIGAEAMYDPEYRSYNGGGKVVIDGI